MSILAVIFGSVLILLVALDAFETIVLPRRVTRRLRLSQLFYRVIRLGWTSLGHLVRAGARRDTFLGYMGPLSLLALLAFWAVLFVFGFGLLLWGLALPLGAIDKPISFLTYLYLSGTTFFTLGLGDVIPLAGTARLLVVIEVALGFIFLALVISYVPIIYQAFSRRELRISLLDARAGSPPTAAELLRRNHAGRSVEELRLLLHDWEVWCADILESHLSYPGFLSLATRTAILGGGADRDPGYVRADLDRHRGHTGRTSQICLCYGPSRSRRPGAGPWDATHAGSESPVIFRLCPSPGRASRIRHPSEGGNGNRAEAGRVS